MTKLLIKLEKNLRERMSKIAERIEENSERLKSKKGTEISKTTYK